MVTTTSSITFERFRNRDVPILRTTSRGEKAKYRFMSKAPPYISGSRISRLPRLHKEGGWRCGGGDSGANQDRMSSHCIRRGHTSMGEIDGEGGGGDRI